MIRPVKLQQGVSVAIIRFFQSRFRTVFLLQVVLYLRSLLSHHARHLAVLMSLSDHPYFKTNSYFMQRIATIYLPPKMLRQATR
jgi:hypothetical protein